MMIGLSRLIRAIADVPKGGMQTGSPKVVLKLADAERIKAELEGVISERDALAKEVDAANDRNAELVEQRDALAAQVVHLHEKLDKALDLILRADIDWYLDGYDDTWITEALAEHAKGIPDAQQCLREVQAEAGRKGFIACFHQQKLIYILDDQLETRADQYAAKVRQGGE